MTYTSTPARDPYFDNAKLLLVLLVVVGHAILAFEGPGQPLRALYLFIYTFHMPAFALLSGFFSSASPDDSRWLRLTTRLLVPYFVFDTGYAVLAHLLNGTCELALEPLVPYQGMWFLLSLFCWRASLPFLARLDHAIPVAFLVGLLAGYVEQLGHVLSLARTMAFLPYFVIGHFLERRHFDLLGSPKVRAAAIVVLASLLGLVLLLGDRVDDRWLLYKHTYRVLGYSGWTAFLPRAVVYGVSLLAAASALALVPRRRSFFNDAGARSMYVYVWQYVPLLLATYLGLFGLVARALSPAALPALSVAGAVACAALLSSRAVRTISWPLVEPPVEWVRRGAVLLLLVPFALVQVDSIRYHDAVFVGLEDVDLGPGAFGPRPERGAVRLGEGGVVIRLKDPWHARRLRLGISGGREFRIVYFRDNRPAATQELQAGPVGVDGIATWEVAVPEPAWRGGYERVLITPAVPAVGAVLRHFRLLRSREAS
jgi:fucose 4-O-acetylase-like acetyltransferase